MVLPASMCLPLILAAVFWSGPAFSDAWPDQSPGDGNPYLLSHRQVAQGPVQPDAYPSIEAVDFFNFAYLLSMCVEPSPPTRIPVKDGAFANEDVRANIVKEEILYSDVTDDDKSEAVVPVFCGPAHANFTNVEIHIYTLRDGKPELLTKLDDNTFAGDYKRYYKDSDSILWPSIIDLEASGKRLTVLKLADGYHACPENQVNFDYVWNGQSFALLGKPVKKPVNNCGHKAPPFANVPGPALQVEKAREAFLKEFRKEPAFIIASIIVRTIMGDATVSSYRFGKVPLSKEFPEIWFQIKGSELLNQGIIKLLKFEKTNGFEGVQNGRSVFTVSYRADLEVSETFTIVDQDPTDQRADIRLYKLSDSPNLKILPRWIPKGTIFKIHGETLLKKTENGWMSE
jgi:hypothetical protein